MRRNRPELRSILAVAVPLHALLLLGLFAGCGRPIVLPGGRAVQAARGAPGGRSGPAETAPSTEALPLRIARRLAATSTWKDAERVLLAERARGEEARARLLLEAMWANQDPVWRSDLLNRLADVPRPERPPWIDQQLGLEAHPPPLSSTAAPAALSRVAAALAGRSLLPDLLRAAEEHRQAGDFIEAAGVMTLAQLVLEAEDDGGAIGGEVRRAWRALADRRRCVAEVFDAAQPGGRWLNPIPAGRPGQPRSVRPAELVTRVLLDNPARLPCAVLAMQLASTRPQVDGGGWAARAVMSPILVSAQFASLDLLSARRASAGPLMRADSGAVRGALRQGIQQFLGVRPGEGWRLLPLFGQDPGGTLARDRLDDQVLGLLFQAPAFAEAGVRIRQAYQRHQGPVSGDPLRYVAYVSQLGPAWAGDLVSALREGEPEVLAAVVSGLSAYPPEVVAAALARPPEVRPGAIGSAEERMNRQVVRALFRLPVDGAAARRTALDLHRCCRGDQGSCERLSVSHVARCPAWTPLTWW